MEIAACKDLLLSVEMGAVLVQEKYDLYPTNRAYGKVLLRTFRNHGPPKKSPKAQLYPRCHTQQELPCNELI